MAGINDYSNTPSLNTTINTIDVDEGCNPANINNAIRQLMADIADVDDGVVPLQTPDINGGTIDGATIGGTTPGAGTFTTATATTFSGSGASLTNIPNSALTNSSITINGTATALGGSINVGDITGVTAGTGLSGGGTTGTVTLNVSGLTVSELAGGSLTTSAEAFADNDTTLMTSAAIDDRILSYGYTTNVGDITGVTAGTGLTGGGTSGTVTLNTSQDISTSSTPTFAGMNLTANLDLQDNDKILLGTSDDLEIYHNGSVSRISDVGTGNLEIQATNLRLQNANGAQDYAFFTSGGSARLYYNGSSKLETTSSGVDVTGTFVTDKGYIAEATLTDAATISWNMSSQSVCKVTLGGNRTLAAPTNGSTGQFATITVIQDGTGSRTLTWNAVYEFKDDTAPTLTTTGGKGDVFVFKYNGSKWLEVGRNLNLTLS